MAEPASVAQEEGEDYSDTEPSKDQIIFMKERFKRGECRVDLTQYVIVGAQASLETTFNAFKLTEAPPSLEEDYVNEKISDILEFLGTGMDKDETLL